MGKLTKDLVRTLSEPGRYSDGDGLILQISTSGGKSWLLRVQINGRRRDIGLGRVDEVPLTKARASAAEMRKLAHAGIDPLEERRKERIVVPTFEEAAKQVHKELLGAWKNGKHTDQWLTTLRLYAFPKLGKLRVDEIEGPLIRDVLADIWLKIPETARRVKQRIGTVLDWSYAKGFRTTEAPMRSLSKGLARQPKKSVHHAAMRHEDLPSFVQKLRAKPLTVGRVALEALILTATRSGEIRGARWQELSDDFSVWTIPGERMKAGVTHAIPLSKQAADIFRLAKGFQIKDCDLVFPGQISQSPLSDMTLLEILRGMDTGVTVHGFRSTFRDWVADITDYPREVAEAALAHTLENKVEAAYRRTDFFAKRRKLMEDWANFCAATAASPVATRIAKPVKTRSRRVMASSQPTRQRSKA
ncbi:integrase arm-type DNA-binding domain-containing protein [Novosphingobium sp. G106]|uniref:tyrosine-type recombinase/integrase n=1 Tax=Novosphingobium sp. G106 TaxID=2849500 RepID=UPI001C2CDEBE|nr:integrase arm-type DNA-binding domain-containing protein [Novosphingobium sp. G106]MBV1691489.1 integrase arm-type DNA-binding domain-containing protein [Novosphingobium sp. G106]